MVAKNLKNKSALRFYELKTENNVISTNQK